VQKLREVLANYGDIDAHSADERRHHLGIKSDVTTTSSGVAPIGIHFNSTQLHLFHANKPKKVTMYLNPDYL
jgi:putative transposase